MAAVEQLLRPLLLTFSAVTDIVGTGAAARIRSDRLEQDDDDTLSSLIIDVDSEEHLNDLDGLGGRLMCDVTLRCRALTRSGARSLAEAVRINGTDPGTGLAGYSGDVSGSKVDAWLESEQLVFTPREEGSDRGWYEVFAGYRVTFSEAT